jgi:hypothetical protein
VANSTGATCPTGVPHSFNWSAGLRQICVAPTLRIVCRSVVIIGTVQVSVTLLPLRVARRSCGGLGKLREGGCGGAIVAQSVKISVAPSASSSGRAERVMRTASEYQNALLIRSSSKLDYPTSSSTASRNAFVWLSTSSLSVCGHISAILWKGVSRIPRFMAYRCMKRSSSKSMASWA